MNQQLVRITETASAFETGSQVMAPILRYAMLRMHGILHFVSKRHDGIALFASRAGLRMRFVYHQFCSAAGIEPFPRWQHLWISRLMAAKGIWASNPETTLDVLKSEFRHASRKDFVEAMLGPAFAEPLLEGRGSENLDLEAFLGENSAASQAVKRHFSEQAQRFGSYIDDTVAGFKTGIIVLCAARSYVESRSAGRIEAGFDCCSTPHNIRSRVTAASANRRY